MKNFSRIYTGNEYIELSWMSLAYIDAGAFLVESILEEEFPDSVHRSLVPVFLIHQGLELLYKSVLKFKIGKYPRTHDLRNLRGECVKCCPEVDFSVPEVVLGANPCCGDPTNVVQHELLRYPRNQKGVAWSQDKRIDLRELKEALAELNKASINAWYILRQESNTD